MKQQNPFVAGCAGCISLIFLGVIAIFVWIVVSAASQPPAQNDTYLVGLDGTNTIAVSRSWDEWNETARLQAEQGPARAGLYATNHGALLIPAGTHVRVVSRHLGQYGINIAEIQLPDGRVGWINRAALPENAR